MRRTIPAAPATTPISKTCSYQISVQDDTLTAITSPLSGRIAPIYPTDSNINALPWVQWPNLLPASGDVSVPALFVAYNGIYKLNSMPSPDLYDAFSIIASDPDLQTFQDAISACGMEGTFSAVRQSQVFAPTQVVRCSP